MQTEQQTIRTGDTVLHRPSGEKWLVAYVSGDRLAWCGWPEGEAKLADCELLKTCTDERHWELVNEIAKSASGARARHCQWMLNQRAATTQFAIDQLSESNEPIVLTVTDEQIHSMSIAALDAHQAAVRRLFAEAPAHGLVVAHTRDEYRRCDVYVISKAVANAD